MAPPIGLRGPRSMFRATHTVISCGAIHTAPVGLSEPSSARLRKTVMLPGSAGKRPTPPPPPSTTSRSAAYWFCACAQERARVSLPAKAGGRGFQGAEEKRRPWVRGVHQQKLPSPVQHPGKPPAGWHSTSEGQRPAILHGEHRDGIVTAVANIQMAPVG